MHRLLQRQLKRHGGSAEQAPADWPAFVAAADEAYLSADDDRQRLERALDLTSRELNERNETLRGEINQREIAERQLKESIRRLRRKNEQISQLNTLGERLQSCRNLEAAYGVIAEGLERLFLNHGGEITLIEEGAGAARSVARWGAAERLARLRERCASPSSPPPCASEPCLADGGELLCITLSSQGRPQGMIRILLREDPEAGQFDSALDQHAQLVQATADHINLSLDNLKLQESLRQQTIRDPLTGLYNRRHMEVSLEREVSRARRGDKPLGVMMIDIDHFKRFNDSFGHQAGDAVLAGVGGFLNRQVRGEDIACRYGGEEFMLILPGADLQNTRRRAEQIRRDIAETVRVDFAGAALGQITVSLGVSCLQGSTADPREVIGQADEALYRAKNGGRNRVACAGE